MFVVPPNGVNSPLRAGLDWVLSFMPHGEKFHLHRRIMNECLNPSAMHKWEVKLADKAAKWALKLSQSPDSPRETNKVLVLPHHLRTNTANPNVEWLGV